MFYMCEFEDSVPRCQEALDVLAVATTDFQELIRQIRIQDQVEEVCSTSVSWLKL